MSRRTLDDEYDLGFDDLDSFLERIRKLPTLDGAADISEPSQYEKQRKKSRQRRSAKPQRQKREYPADNRVASLHADGKIAKLFEVYRDASDLAFNAGYDLTVETYNKSPAGDRKFASQTEMRRHARALLPECRDAPSTIVDSAINEVFLALRKYQKLKNTADHVPFPKERRRLRVNGRHFTCKQIVVDRQRQRILVPQPRHIKRYEIWVDYVGDIAPGDRLPATFIKKGAHWIVVTRDRTA